jgi:hypothetical protein
MLYHSPLCVSWIQSQAREARQLAAALTLSTDSDCGKDGVVNQMAATSSTDSGSDQNEHNTDDDEDALLQAALSMSVEDTDS